MDNKEVRPDDTQVSAASIGDTLRHAREARNLSIEHAANQLHLDAKLLKAIEQNDFDALPGAAYAYGYLRSYAKLLKLSEEAVLQQFLQMTQIDSNALVPEHMTFALKNKVPSFSFVQTLLMIFFVVTILAAIAWVLLGNVLEKTTNELSTNETSEQMAVEAASQSVIEPVADEAVSLQSKLPPVDEQQAAIPDSTEVKHVEDTVAVNPSRALQLTYQEDSWTEVRDASGETLIYRMVKGGERLELAGKAPYTILLGYAPGVSVRYNDTLFDTKPYQRDDIAYFRVGKKTPNLATE